MDKALKQEYQLLQHRAKLAAEEKKREVCLRQPRLKELADLKRDLLFELGIRMKTAEDAAALRERTLLELAALTAEEEGLLRELGLTKADLEPHYECEKCKDTGFLGEAQQTFCTCYQQKLSRRRIASSHLDGRETFESFDETVFVDEPQKKRALEARRYAERYADAFPDNERKNLVFFGSSGQGKTYLLNCIAHRVAQRGCTVVKHTAYSLIDSLASAFREGKEAPREFLRADLLCIDDLGTEPMMKNITREYVFSILNERQNAGKGTVIATNLPFEELKHRYGERVISRLISPRESAVLELTGPDIRLRK